MLSASCSLVTTILMQYLVLSPLAFLFPLNLLYYKSVAILMHDISNSLTSAITSNLFASQSNIHSYITRSSSRVDYYVKHSRLDKQTKSFSRYGVKIWNSLPCEMRQMSKNSLKINVHDTLLRIKIMIIVELPRAKRSSMGNKIW